MKQKLELEPSEKLAYWVGVAQSDGSLQFDRHSIYEKVSVTKKSLPMLIKFFEISKKLFGIKSKLYKLKSKDVFGCKITLTQFKEFVKTTPLKEPFCPPTWCSVDRLFGAYLAGLIDGDGDVRITRPKYPQCAIRIWSALPMPDLAKVIRSTLDCSASILKDARLKSLEGRKFLGICYRIEFYISRKTLDFIRSYVLPHLTIPHKIEKLEKFLGIREMN